ICDGDSVIIGSQTYFTAGNYTVHLQTSFGCDSAVNLNLQVNPRKSNNISQTICEGENVTIGVQTFIATGNYSVNLQTSLGCDSTVNLDLTVNPKASKDLVQTICEGESVTIGVQTFNATGTYTVHFQTSLGCDSAVNLDLTVNPVASKPQIDLRNDSLVITEVAGAQYQWYLNGNLQFTTSTPAFKPTQSGSWTVVVTLANC